MENKIQIKWFQELDSTSNELLRHMQDYDNLSVVAAVNQTAGRGQRGNRWLSKPGDNLTFSLLVRFPLPDNLVPSLPFQPGSSDPFRPDPSHPFPPPSRHSRPDRESLPAREVMAVTCLSALAVRDCLREAGVQAVIKWPNDIYAGNRKICGMLIENGLEGDSVAWSVIGIGVNLNQTEFPGELVNPTSVKRLTGRSCAPEAFLSTLCERLEQLLPELDSPAGRTRLREAYARDLFQKDSPAPYRDLATGKEFTGILRGVTPEGLVRIEAEGTERTFGFKEIGYIL